MEEQRESRSTTEELVYNNVVRKERARGYLTLYLTLLLSTEAG